MVVRIGRIYGTGASCSNDEPGWRDISKVLVGRRHFLLQNACELVMGCSRGAEAIPPAKASACHGQRKCLARALLVGRLADKSILSSDAHSPFSLFIVRCVCDSRAAC